MIPDTEPYLGLLNYKLNPGKVMNHKYKLFWTVGRVWMWHSLNGSQLPTRHHANGSIMMCSVFICHGLSSLVCLNMSLTFDNYVTLYGHFHPFIDFMYFIIGYSGRIIFLYIQSTMPDWYQREKISIRNTFQLSAKHNISFYEQEQKGWR